MRFLNSYPNPYVCCNCVLKTASYFGIKCFVEDPFKRPWIQEAKTTAHHRKVVGRESGLSDKSSIQCTGKIHWVPLQWSS